MPGSPLNSWALLEVSRKISNFFEPSGAVLADLRKMAKDKKRSHEEVSSTVSPGRSPKKAKNGQFPSPGSKGKSPKRDQRNGAEGGKGSSAKGAVNGSTAGEKSEKSPRKKVNGHMVSGKDGTNGMLEDVEAVVENSNGVVTTDTKEAKVPTPKKQKKSHGSGTPSKKDNGPSDSKEDLTNLFSEHDRLLPGPKRTAMADSYSTSEPYISPPSKLTSATNTSSSPISSILHSSTQSATKS